jgi:hypothetical protein
VRHKYNIAGSAPVSCSDETEQPSVAHLVPPTDRPTAAMSEHVRPLDRDICGRVQDGLYELLTSVGVWQVLDVRRFVEREGREPCISSVFVVDNGTLGNRHFTDAGGRAIDVCNGTLRYVDAQFFCDVSDCYREMMDRRDDAQRTASARCDDANQSEAAVERELVHRFRSYATLDDVPRARGRDAPYALADARGAVWSACLDPFAWGTADDAANNRRGCVVRGACGRDDQGIYQEECAHERDGTALDTFRMSDDGAAQMRAWRNELGRRAGIDVSMLCAE